MQKPYRNWINEITEEGLKPKNKKNYLMTKFNISGKNLPGSLCNAQYREDFHEETIRAFNPVNGNFHLNLYNNVMASL